MISTGVTFYYCFEEQGRAGAATGMGTTRKQAGEKEWATITVGVKILLAEGSERGSGQDRWTLPEGNEEIREGLVGTVVVGLIMNC